MGYLSAALVLLAFFGGWLASARFRRRRAHVPIPRIYVQGLGHLLGERNDEAVQAFLDALRQYPESAELLLALGRLFRRRGELERALSIHQHLLEQQELDLSGKQEVLLEIARDYLKAGILNRAESILQDLLHRDPGSMSGRELLAELYELGADWRQAIRVRQELRERGRAGQEAVIALLFCQLAEESLRHGDALEAQKCLLQAERADRASLRLALLRGRLAYQQQDWEGAARSWSALLAIDHAAILAQVFEEFLESLARCKHPDCSAWYAQLLAHGTSPALLPRLVAAIGKVEGDAVAIRYLQGRIQQSADLQLLQLYLRAGGDPVQVLTEIQRAVAELPLSEIAFQCHHCGYQTAEFYWRCPSCRHWGSFRSGGLAA